jgi:hypothetical protein
MTSVVNATAAACQKTLFMTCLRNGEGYDIATRHSILSGRYSPYYEHEYALPESYELSNCPVHRP